MSFFKKVVKYVKPRDLLDLLIIIAACPIGLILRLFKKDIWLISERANEAHDNGYWFFKFVRENYPQRNAYYSINFNSGDYINKIKPLGNAIQHGSFRHHIYMWACSKFVSAHIGDSYPARLASRFFVLHGLYPFKFVFLQHGVIQNAPPFLLSENNNLDVFIASAERERQGIIKDLHYSPNQVVCAGLCRYDNLADFKVKKNQVLIMPTWRWWLSPEHDRSIQNREPLENSNYFIQLKALLTNKRLIDFAIKNNIELCYFPHFEMQQYMQEFKSVCANIKCFSNKEYDVQQALKDSALLITDYSSIAFDFAYMKKPLIYFQHDYEEFCEKHYPEGYFKYNEDGYGPVCATVDEVVESLIQMYKNNFQMAPEYQKRVDEFFAFRDDKNTARNFKCVERV